MISYQLASKIGWLQLLLKFTLKYVIGSLKNIAAFLTFISISFWFPKLGLFLILFLFLFLFIVFVFFLFEIDELVYKPPFIDFSFDYPFEGLLLKLLKELLVSVFKDSKSSLIQNVEIVRLIAFFKEDFSFLDERVLDVLNEL